MSVVGLERALLQYCSQPNEQPFDMKTVPIETASIGERPICKHLYVVVQFRSVHTHRRSCMYIGIRPQKNNDGSACLVKMSRKMA